MSRFFVRQRLPAKKSTCPFRFTSLIFEILARALVVSYSDRCVFYGEFLEIFDSRWPSHNLLSHYLPLSVPGFQSIFFGILVCFISPPTAIECCHGQPKLALTTIPVCWVEKLMPVDIKSADEG